MTTSSRLADPLVGHYQAPARLVKPPAHVHGDHARRSARNATLEVSTNRAGRESRPLRLTGGTASLVSLVCERSFKPRTRSLATASFDFGTGRVGCTCHRKRRSNEHHHIHNTKSQPKQERGFNERLFWAWWVFGNRSSSLSAMPVPAMRRAARRQRPPHGSPLETPAHRRRPCMR